MPPELNDDYIYEAETGQWIYVEGRADALANAEDSAIEMAIEKWKEGRF